jgi:streptogramin lyase
MAPAIANPTSRPRTFPWLRGAHRRARLLVVTALLAGAVLVTAASPVHAAPVITELSTGITSTGLRDVATGPDGNLWFTEWDKDRVGRISPTGVVTEFFQGIEPGAAPLGIVGGPDGNVWFTEYARDRIGRISPSGEVQELSIGISVGSGPAHITVGPDHSLWFTEAIANKIGRITTDGTVTEYSVGLSPASEPWGITAGPDGNVWFTERSGSRIGRITPFGVITEFTQNVSPGGQPTDIAAGPDGNLWFTAPGANSIGVISPKGVATAFTNNISAMAEPTGIAPGPDGNLYFTERKGSRIGKVTPAGAITEHSGGITANSHPNGIATGPDGNVWFAEEAGRIGRFGNFPGASFHPLAPVRLLDSRGPTGGWNGKLFAWNPRSVQVTGANGIPKSATSVVLNVTVTESSYNSFLTVYPDGEAPPNASNVNFAAGQTIPNAVTVRVGMAGRIAFNTAVGKTHVVVDAVGYYDTASANPSYMHPVNPKRFLDSRTATGGWNGTLGAGDANVRTLKVANVSPVGATATAVVLNVTVTNPSAGSFLEVWPTGTPRPTASNVNFAPGQTVANLVTVPVGAGSQVSFFNAVGTTDVVADLVGWYDSASGSTYHALGTPNRVLDDRVNLGFNGPFPGGASAFVTVGGVSAVPLGATGLVMNTTVTNGTLPSYITVWPNGPAKPTASTVNFGAGQTIANLAMPALPSSGILQIFNNAGKVDVIGDATGYFA